MATAILHRPVARNEHGDPVDGDGDVVRLGDDEHVGQLTVIVGGPSWRPVNGAHGDVVDTSDMIGVEVSEPVQPQAGDTLVIAGTKFHVRGPAQWSHDSVLTGTPRRWRWWTITARA